jgi:hypothetical protein
MRFKREIIKLKIIQINLDNKYQKIMYLAIHLLKAPIKTTILITQIHSIIPTIIISQIHLQKIL